MRSLAAALLLVFLGSAAQAQDRAAAGRYQAILGDCEGCHTAPTGKPFAGGLVLQTPFGDMGVPNITQDRSTGIGNWSEAEFRRAIREGVAPGGRRLYPAMPYPYFARMSDADLSSLWAYLKTLAPVRHAVEVNRLRFPFDVRTLMTGWDWLYFKSEAFKPVAGKSAEWNRGAYLVTGPGHCGACHTAKTLLGADRAALLTGDSLQGWFAPEITGAKPRGVGGWSVNDVVTYLKTGWNAHSVASGPMADVVERSTSQMNDGDLQAIAVYLKDQPAADSEQQNALAANDPAMTAGAQLYRQNCVGCHGWDGKGEGLIVPPLAGNAALIQTSAENLIRIVLAGAQSVTTKSTPTEPSMPSFAWKLDDRQMADLLTYVRNSWGNQAPRIRADSIAKVRAGLRGGS
ncbi:MAG TPA: cytochrome c [Rhizomicrobium sp.]|nr:cytochrome c [Rhizomicrobium sp.]